MADARLPALTPHGGQGHQFVCYADCCSGLPHTEREATFAALNKIIRQLNPPPEFICFPGDEIRGLTADEAALRCQWAYWFQQEMAWLDQTQIPLYHTTGNHTAYDSLSERVFQEVMAHLPQNGPPGQKGLSYWLRRDDLLLIFVNTMGTGLGGEGRVETTWLAQTLAANADASYKLVIGHHPVFPINGFSGPGQREIFPENGQAFWQVLVQHQVTAYLCSHLLAFDVQAHDGVLQILTAGAGTPYLMPPETEYHHLVQMALDATGLRYQVLDTTGRIREWLRWPMPLPSQIGWNPLPFGPQPSPLNNFNQPDPLHHEIILLRFSGQLANTAAPHRQTFLAGWHEDGSLAPLWVGLVGPEKRFCVQLSAAPGRSPHQWLGPTLPTEPHFELQLALHTGMGPGGLLWRWGDEAPWSSLIGSTAWGLERLKWPAIWSVGHGQYGANDHPVQASQWQVSWFQQQVHFSVS